MLEDFGNLLNQNYLKIGIFASLYNFFLHILFLPLKWLQQNCNVSHSKTLQTLSNIFEFENTKLYINFSIFVSYHLLGSKSVMTK